MANFYEYKRAHEKLSSAALEVIEQLKWAANQGMWHNVDVFLIEKLATAISRMNEGEYEQVEKICQEIEERL